MKKFMKMAILVLMGVLIGAKAQTTHMNNKIYTNEEILQSLTDSQRLFLDEIREIQMDEYDRVDDLRFKDLTDNGHRDNEFNPQIYTVTVMINNKNNCLNKTVSFDRDGDIKYGLSVRPLPVHVHKAIEERITMDAK